MYQGFKGKLEAVGLGRVTGGRIGTTQRTRALDPAESGHFHIIRNDHETYQTQGGPFLPTL